MADDVETQIKIAEAEAQARLRLQQQQGGVSAAPESGIGERVGTAALNAVKGIPGALWDTAKNFATDMSSGQFPGMGIGQRMAGHPETIAPNIAMAADAGIGLATGGLGAAASYPLLMQGAHAANRYFGLEDKVDPVQQLEQLTGDSVGSFSMLGLGKTATRAPVQEIASDVGNIGKGVYQGAVRDPVFGKPHDVLLQEQAGRPDIYANKLNVEQTTGGAETNLAQEAERYKGAFTRTNPVAGIDTSNLTGAEASAKFKANLEASRIKATNDRTGILTKVSEAESQAAAQAAASGVPAKVGVSYEDIPKNVTDPATQQTYGFDHIAKYTDGGTESVAIADNLLKEKFGITPEIPYEGPTGNFGRFGGGSEPNQTIPANPGRPLTASELNDAIADFDNQIKALGGYDINPHPDPLMTPSRIDSQVKAYEFARAQLKAALHGHVSAMAGPEAATRFAQTGEEIGSAKFHEKLRADFSSEVGRGLTEVRSGEGSVGTGGQAKGMGGRAYDAATAGASGRKTAANALSREGATIRDLQRLVELNTNGAPKPAPRGWALIKASAKHLGNIGMLGMQLGLLPDPTALLQMPDDQAQKVVGIIAGAFPQAFEPTPDRVNVIDNKFQDPMSKDSVVAQSLDLPAEDRAMRIGASFHNRYVPPRPQEQPQQPPPALPHVMEQMKRWASEPMPTPSQPTASADLMSQMDNLTRSKSLHAQDDGS